ncbi:MAG: NAD(P)-binding domain-containing protein [Acidobacteria bacterium]|nr:NAD(P)-binding domain-containing protein [Acidobacteriota bacterium]
MGVRDVSSPKVTDLLKDIGSGATAASVRDAADFGEIIVLATPWSAVQDAVKAWETSAERSFRPHQSIQTAARGARSGAGQLWRRICSGLGAKRQGCQNIQHRRSGDDGGCLFRTGQAGYDLLRQRPSGEADGRNTRH